MQIESLKGNTKFKVCNAIRSMLLHDEEVHGLVQDRIYPIIAPEATKGNYIVYQRDRYSISKTKFGIYEQQCTVYISCVSSSYDTSNKMAESVFSALQGLCNYVDRESGCTISSIDLEDSTEDFGNDVYVQTLAFSIK